MDAIRYVGAKTVVDGEGRPMVVFSGWARMAIPLRRGALTITDVSKPSLGERIPAEVRAEVNVDLAQYDWRIKNEWDELKEHDVVFLVTIEDPQGVVVGGSTTATSGGGGGKSRRKSEEEEVKEFCSRYGIKYVRGGVIWEVRDEENYILNDPSGRPDTRRGGRGGGKGGGGGGGGAGSRRQYKVLLDPAQYYSDMKEGSEVYESINLLVRRRAKENNFKAVLETMRELMNSTTLPQAVPVWLHDVLLGYGNPTTPYYRSLPLEEQLRTGVSSTSRGRSVGRRNYARIEGH